MKSSLNPLDQAIALLKDGQPVGMPTETVYGLAASAFDETGIERIFELKGRPADNPLIVHVASAGQAEGFASQIPELAKKLMHHFWPGPLTLVLPKKAQVLDRITAGLPSVALRMPRHPLALELLRHAGPLVAPSANKSGRPSPTCARHIHQDFGDDVFVLDGGPCQLGLESTVVRVLEEELIILRPGIITAEQLKISADIGIRMAKTEENLGSPGIKYSHYAPNAKVVWMDDMAVFNTDKTFFISITTKQKGVHQLWVDGDFDLLARGMYDAFRRADLSGLQTVAVERFSEQTHPTAPALLNRLEKAMTRR